MIQEIKNSAYPEIALKAKYDETEDKDNIQEALDNLKADKKRGLL